MSARTKRLSGALLSGLLFGAGLVLSGMSDPRRVLAFLNLRGSWDASLLFVMLAATLVYFLAYRWSRGRAASLSGDRFALPSRTPVDAQLILGAALFGVGWGLSGFCPAPSLIALSSATPGIFVFVGASVAASLLTRRLEASRRRVKAHVADAPV